MKKLEEGIEPWAQHRTEIHFSIWCSACGKQRAAYSPTKEYSNLEAYCLECAAKRRAKARAAATKRFKAGQRWLIDPSQFQTKP